MEGCCVALGALLMAGSTNLGCSGVDGDRPDLAGCTDEDCEPRVGAAAPGAAVPGAGGSIAGSGGSEGGTAGIPSVGGGLGVGGTLSPPVDIGVGGSLVPGGDIGVGGTLAPGVDIGVGGIVFATGGTDAVDGTLAPGVDIGVGGSTNFVQELAPNAPYRVMFAASYAADLQPKPPVIREVEKRVEVPLPPPPTGRLRGRVLEKGDPLVIADAKITFPGRDLNPLLGNADGTFVTYAFDPGEVQLEIEADGYEPGTCTGVIPPEGGVLLSGVAPGVPVPAFSFGEPLGSS